ncbi:DUF4254 domain-containing protein [Roseateles sp. DC23W]|uniref:DUF4254 domain-containing protein n=1 Tax=Pelomonas dachongensis TaxID=3299029 RepID=A0ABW7EN82_9BURK
MPEITLPSAAEVIAAHDAALTSAPVTVEPDDLRGWIAANHFHNRSLWAQEDLARRKLAPDAEIVANKRAIDRHNQQRNDAIERVDEFLLSALGLVDPATLTAALPRSTVAPGARLNSETAGSMLDRISILGLKIAAMREQTLRTDVDDAHRESCDEKLQRLSQQRLDLGACYDELLADARAGRAYFKVYRQFKMYNDPRLNPALVAESK